ncbi:MAG: hypothetical protein D6707_11330, partial [Bacteroidetes bacterium]
FILIDRRNDDCWWGNGSICLTTQITPGAFCDIGFVHTKGVNVLFIDNHVQRLHKPSGILPVAYDVGHLWK